MKVGNDGVALFITRLSSKLKLVELSEPVALLPTTKFYDQGTNACSGSGEGVDRLFITDSLSVAENLTAD